jgi:hypothetical protein
MAKKNEKKNNDSLKNVNETLETPEVVDDTLITEDLIPEIMDELIEEPLNIGAPTEVPVELQVVSKEEPKEPEAPIKVKTIADLNTSELREFRRTGIMPK